MGRRCWENQCQRVGKIGREVARESDSYCLVERGKENLERKKLKVENEKRHTAGGHGRLEKRVVLAAWCYVQV